MGGLVFLGRCFLCNLVSPPRDGKHAKVKKGVQARQGRWPRAYLYVWFRRERGKSKRARLLANFMTRTPWSWLVERVEKGRSKLRNDRKTERSASRFMSLSQWLHKLVFHNGSVDVDSVYSAGCPCGDTVFYLECQWLFSRPPVPCVWGSRPGHQLENHRNQGSPSQY